MTNLSFQLSWSIFKLKYDKLLLLDKIEESHTESRDYLMICLIEVIIYLQIQICVHIIVLS